MDYCYSMCTVRANITIEKRGRVRGRVVRVPIASACCEQRVDQKYRVWEDDPEGETEDSAAELQDAHDYGWAC